MKVVGFQASPRKNGNCDVLMDEVLSAAKAKGADTSKFYLDDLEIEPCHACGKCGDGIDCATDDDCQMLLKQALSADAIVFSSPIYYGQMTAQGKLFTDRFYSISRNPQKSLEGKKAVLIFTHGAPDGTYSQYIELTKASPFGHVGFEITDVIAAGGIQEAGIIKDNTDVLAKAKEAGSNL